MASAGRLRFGRPGTPAPPLPLTQTIAFGSPTRKGYGGSPCAYTGGGTLSIVSQVNNVSAPVSIFAIDGHNHLVYAWTGTTPAGSGAYGSAPPTVSAGPYTVEVTDGTYTSIITVPIDTYYYVAPHATNPNIDTTSVDQLKLTAQLTTLAYGEEIVLRDGVYNSAQLDTRIRRGALVGSWTGTWVPCAGSGPDWNIGHWTTPNWVIIRAENPGQAYNKRMTVEGVTQNNQYLSFRDIIFNRVNNAGTTSVSTGQVALASSAKIVDFQDCSFLGDPAAAPVPAETNSVSGIVGSVGTEYLTISGCTFDYLSMAVSSFGPHVATTRNVYSRIYVDCLSYADGYDLSSSWEFMIDKRIATTASPTHGDFYQMNATLLPAGTYDGFVWVGNVMVRGSGTAGKEDGQGPFGNPATTASGVIYTGMYIRGNTYIGTMSRGISPANATAPDISFNTVVQDIPENYLTPDESNIINWNGIGGTIGYNVASGAIQDEGYPTPGTVPSPSTFTGSVIINNTLPDYETAFVNPQVGTANVSLAQVAADWAMLENGALDKDETGFTYNVGSLGTGYVDVINRTTNFPI